MSRDVQREAVDFTAPLPLGYPNVLKKGLELHRAGLPWSAISKTVEHYHGFKRGPAWWRKELAGVVAPRPRGMAVYGTHRVYEPGRRQVA